jgi:hypothetical protein
VTNLTPAGSFADLQATVVVHLPSKGCAP